MEKSVDVLVLSAASKSGVAICAGAVVALMDTGELKHVKAIFGVGYGNFVVAQLISILKTIPPQSLQYNQEEKGIERIPLHDNVDSRWTTFCSEKKDMFVKQMALFCNTNYDALAMQTLSYWISGKPGTMSKLLANSMKDTQLQDIPQHPLLLPTGITGAAGEHDVSITCVTELAGCDLRATDTLLDYVCSAALPSKYGTKLMGIGKEQTKFPLTSGFAASPAALNDIMRTYKGKLPKKTLLIDCLSFHGAYGSFNSIYKRCASAELAVFDLLGGTRVITLREDTNTPEATKALIRKLRNGAEDMVSLGDLTAPAINYGYAVTLTRLELARFRQEKTDDLPISSEFDDHDLLLYLHNGRTAL